MSMVDPEKWDLDFNCFSKTHRAGAHFRELKRMVEEWLTEAGTKAWLEPDPDADGYFVAKAEIKPLHPQPMAAVLGDGIQNLRCSLDHIVYSLALENAGELSEREQQASQFPIIAENTINKSGKSRFNAAKGSTIAKLSPKAQSIVESFQPYQRGPDYRAHPLWKLNQLANHDKHRAIPVVAAVHAGMKLVITQPPFRGKFNEDMNITSGGVAGLVTLATHLKVDDQGDNWKLTPWLYVAFGDGPLKDLDVMQVVEELYNFVRCEVLAQLFPLVWEKNGCPYPVEAIGP
jgi:hypothetical protein